MEGDYYRYLAELGKDKEQSILGSSEAYNKGIQIAADLPPTHPIRLGLVLNYSVFYYEVKEDAESALKIAKDAFDEATSILENLTDDSHKDSITLLQLIRENMEFWSQPEDNETQE